MLRIRNGIDQLKSQGYNILMRTYPYTVILAANLYDPPFNNPLYNKAVSGQIVLLSSVKLRVGRGPGLGHGGWGVVSLKDSIAIRSQR